MSSPTDSRSSGSSEAPLDEKDAQRLRAWLEELDAEVAHYAQAPFAERLRIGLRLMRQGQTKRQRKIYEQFRKWAAAKSTRAPSSNKQARSHADPAADRVSSSPLRSGDEAPATLSDQEQAGLKQTSLCLYDLAGPEALKATLDNAEIPWSAFASVELISPWPLAKLPALPASVHFTPLDGDPLDLFKLLDRRVRTASSEPRPLVLFLETGAWPLRSFAELTANQAPQPVPPVRLLRTFSTSEDKASPLLDQASAERAPLVPQAFPALLIDGERAAERIQFERFLHYTGWDVLLSCLEEERSSATPARPPFAFLPEKPSVGFASHHHNLLDYRSRCLKAHGNEASLRRLLPPSEEWQVLRHDLIVQIVAAHPNYFRDRAAYLAAIAAATVAT